MSSNLLASNRTPMGEGRTHSRTEEVGSITKKEGQPPAICQTLDLSAPRWNLKVTESSHLQVKKDQALWIPVTCPRL